MSPLQPVIVLALTLLSLVAATAKVDYVIVGAGTSGCALAARLCESLPTAQITLLERAPPRDAEAEFLIKSPRQMWNAWASPKVVEFINTLPDPGIMSRELQIFTGNTLGGSSAINGMQFIVPTKGTVESWGIDGLTTEASRKYFKQVFDTVGFSAQKGGLRHLYAGPYIRSAARAGFPTNDDPFDFRSRRDMFENRLAVDSKGRRVDSCTAYLNPVRNTKCRHNLRLIQDATVTKVLLDRSSTRARGVQYVSSSDKMLKNRTVIKARKEVLMCAGPFGSPKLLQLSGIGLNETLRAAGVKQRVDLPVGEHAQARPFVAIESNYTSPLEPSNNSTLLESPASRAQWESGQGGVLGIASFFANGRDKRDAYLTGTGSFFPAFVDQRVLSSNCNGNVRSRGFLHINGSNPFTPPIVQLGLFSKQWDVNATERCLNRLKEVHNSFPKRFGLTWRTPPDGIITQDFIRSTGGWAGHHVAGCAVGTVLDGQLKVKGVSGLRVIDSSSLNRIPVSAGPMASTYMIAEYMAERIAMEFP